MDIVNAGTPLLKPGSIPVIAGDAGSCYCLSRTYSKTMSRCRGGQFFLVKRAFLSGLLSLNLKNGPYCCPRIAMYASKADTGQTGQSVLSTPRCSSQFLTASE